MCVFVSCVLFVLCLLYYFAVCVCTCVVFCVCVCVSNFVVYCLCNLLFVLCRVVVCCVVYGTPPLDVNPVAVEVNDDAPVCTPDTVNVVVVGVDSIITLVRLYPTGVIAPDIVTYCPGTNV